MSSHLFSALPVFLCSGSTFTATPVAVIVLRHTIHKVKAPDEDDDISTERLLEMVRQECNLQDVSDVITGLLKGGILKEESEGS